MQNLFTAFPKVYVLSRRSMKPEHGILLKEGPIVQLIG
jgi:hypothetical protein